MMRKKSKLIQVFITDDHALFREGLAGIIDSQDDMIVIGQAGDGLEAIVKVQELRPDLVLMDIQMPVCDGLEAARQIKKALPEVTIIMLTVRDDEEKLFEAIRNGAQGYLLKNIHAKEMLQMMRSALRGEGAISPSLSGYIMEEFRRLSRSMPEKMSEDAFILTDREQSVLSNAALGKTDKEIAETMHISIHTVKTHMRNILAKLQAVNRREAALIAKEKGLM
jgi:DNA-binding NarL/FixJ family response regulator